MTPIFISLISLFGWCIASSAKSAIKEIETGAFLRYKDLGGKPYEVTSDERSWIINGKRTLLLGGSVHYPRLSPGQWKDILTKMLEDGLNHAEIYVFWNIHEAQYDFSGKHVYNYDGRANLTAFLQTAAQVGIFINLRIGPYVCAEWSFGGLPTWLLHVPGIEFRGDNAPWEKYMQTFVEEIARISEPYLAQNGGPIVMAQIENEYHGSESYVDWCGDLVETLHMNISWVMCNGLSADNTINTCNGNNCYNYAKQHGSKYPGQPLGWTENEGWFQMWTKAYYPDATGWSNRSPQDMAYTVALWFAAGAAHHNYYMWYGGNHVGWTAASGITNYYADGVNYHADGLANEPKKSHLMRLHNVLSEYGEYPLMESSIQVGNEIYLIKGDRNVFAYSYHSSSKGLNVTFLCNIGLNDSTPIWNNKAYSVPATSVSILDNNGDVLYQTANVNTTGLATKRVYKTIYDGSTDLQFSSWSEVLPLTGNPQHRPDVARMNKTPLEQIRFTNMTSEYLYYATNFTLSNSMNDVVLNISGREANAYVVYIDDRYVGEAWDGEHSANDKTFNISVGGIAAGVHTLTVVSSCLGIHNGIDNEQPASAQDMKGIVGSVMIASLDVTNNEWSHWIGRTGEVLDINNVIWETPAVTDAALTWYKTTFITPDDVDDNGGVILLDIGSKGDGMKRGHFWLNGMDLGHYNNVILGAVMVQQYYFIPNDYLTPNKGKNTLIFSEEISNPTPTNCSLRSFCRQRLVNTMFSSRLLV